MEVFLSILAGILGGVLGGMGMGGGTLLIPLLIYMCGVPQHAAQSINLVSFIPMAAVVLILHFRNKLVDWREALWIMLPALFAGAGGALLAGVVRAELLRRLFGGFIVLLGLYQFWTLFQKNNENTLKTS
jgi:uncharacterized membrane protein YfcA